MTDGKVIDRLPAISEEQGILFAKDKVEKAEINGAKLKYEGNIVIENQRVYADMYAIVNETTYKKIIGEEKSIGILKPRDEQIC
ncbi:lipoprotein BA_5634 family protein [Baia soyae]|uniref:lipoprotein BA_5634 family protein n=1 Tax=Baia soyae TaxID=1544746 RepID=UPI001FB2E327|nr:lipoprotein BA_5634 family protein [Baia soyae]